MENNNVITLADRRTAKQNREIHNKRILKEHKLGAANKPLTDEQKYDLINRQLAAHSREVNEGDKIS